MDINYIGELLWAGKLGHFMTILSMMSALFATSAYIFSTNAKDEISKLSWIKLARYGFLTHGFAVFSIIITLFLLIFTHQYEYQYVWQHSSNDLPVYYMLSCFWEGQEGSFLLWTFWHIILGFFVIGKSKKWEAPVMAFVCGTQVFLAAMLIGIYFFEYKIGSSPFILMRDFNPNMPIFMRPNYMEFVEDGSGLNPLLQNYWMVIHPPVLFLGFAATIMPFAYAMAGLWQKDFGKDWIKSSLNWSIFASCTLGVGILMGGAWAYESLSFGGYWAWDPVENASLVPWIVSICGLHTLLAFKHSGHSLKITAILLILTFILILYSTFLTRSGILGDTSVHAFTDLGMSGQLLVFLLSFVFLAIGLLVRNWRTMPTPQKEENTWSREFWLFVGSLIMLLLAVMISIDTSWPVINKLFGTNRVIIEPVEHYNRYSIWFSLAILFLASVTQFFKYKKTDIAKVGKAVALTALVSAVLAGVVAYFAQYDMIRPLSLFNKFDIPFVSTYYLLAWMSIWTILSNTDYIFSVLKGKIKVSGASVAHIGFGFMMLGVLISSSKKQVISLNKLGLQLFSQDVNDVNNVENVYLAKNKPIQMGDYWVTYENEYNEREYTFYNINYERKKMLNDKPTEQFRLSPNAITNPEMGLVSNPDTKHYWTKDVFTYLTSIPRELEEDEKSKTFKEVEVTVGDTIVLTKSLVMLERINPNPENPNYFGLPGDIAAGAVLVGKDLTSNEYRAEPVYYVRGMEETNVPAKIEQLGLEVKFVKINPAKNTIVLQFEEEDKPEEFVIMKAMIFPYINLLWLGCFVMTIGFIMALRRRMKEKLSR